MTQERGKIGEGRAVFTEPILKRPEGAPPIEFRRREFGLPDEVAASLSFHERLELRTLRAVVSRTANLFGPLEGFKGYNPYYPGDLRAGELEEAGERDPELLSPYTLVRRLDSKLVAVPIVQAQAKEIGSLAIDDLLAARPGLFRGNSRPSAVASGTQALRSYRGNERMTQLQFLVYLQSVAESLKTGDFKQPMRDWLSIEGEPKIDLIQGLFDTTNDPRGLKFAWWASVGVLNEEATVETQHFIDKFLSWWQEAEGGSLPSVRMRVDHTVMMSGQAAERLWRANSIPCQREWREEMGSKFVIFEPAFDISFNKQYQNFGKYINPEKRRGVSVRMAKRAAERHLAAHETSHSLGIAKDLEQRIGGGRINYPLYVKELYCDLAALVGYGEMPKGSVAGNAMADAREREVALALYLAAGIDKKDEYHRASSVILDHLIKTGSIVAADGKLTWEDQRAAFRQIRILFEEVKKLQRLGNRKDAARFFGHRYNPTLYNELLNDSSSGQVREKQSA